MDSEVNAELNLLNTDSQDEIETQSQPGPSSSSSTKCPENESDEDFIPTIQSTHVTPGDKVRVIEGNFKLKIV